MLAAIACVCGDSTVLAASLQAVQLQLKVVSG